MNHFEKIFQCFPMDIQREITALDKSILDGMEEIRIYKGKSVQIYSLGKKIYLKGIFEGTQINNLLNNLMKFSYYAYEEDLAKGFITIDGGHRVGICGKTVIDKGKVVLIRDISSLNIRYAREVPGCATSVLNHIVNSSGIILNCLIVSPPGCGKTTLLRDIVRNLSLKEYKVAVCDERSEIAGMYNGLSSYDLGKSVDIMDGCPKAEGMIMLVRSMSPHVVITDEIGKKEDVEAIKTCLASGVKVIATAHGSSMEDLEQTEVYPTIKSKVFNRVIFLTDKPTVGTVKEVLYV